MLIFYRPEIYWRHLRVFGNLCSLRRDSPSWVPNWAYQPELPLRLGTLPSTGKEGTVSLAEKSGLQLIGWSLGFVGQVWDVPQNDYLNLRSVI